MSKQVDEGGPAFPLVTSTENGAIGQVCESGMTLRDWFAGQALVGLLRHPDAVGEAEETLATWSYAQADAMLAARGGAK